MRKIEDVKIKCSDGVCLISTNLKDVFIKIDEEDLPKVSDYCWLAVKSNKSNSLYAKSPGYQYKDKGSSLIHRRILNAPKGLHIDHIDGDGLNNCKSNLRICTHKENLRNSVSLTGVSKYKGVSPSSKNGWRAYIAPDRKQIHLGCFKTEEEAALAYNEAALKYFGAFAKLNICPSK